VASADRAIRGANWAEPLRQCLAAPPVDVAAWMTQHTRLLKSDDYSRVGLLDVRGQSCWIKLYLAKSPWQRLGFQMGCGRGIRSFDAATELLRKGFSVPAPRSCLLVPGGLVLLTEGIAGSRDLRALWLAQPAVDQAERLMRCAGTCLAALHQAGFAHGDCKWSNLLWDGGQFYLVDLEAVREVKYTGAAALQLHARQLQDLARFTVDAEELGAGREPYSCFLQSYCARAHCTREQLAAGIKPAAEAIRARHAKKYGSRPQPLL